MKPMRSSILNIPLAFLAWFVLMVLLVLMAPLWAGASSSADGPASSAGEAAKRPNILFIYTDDQSHRTVSCYPEVYVYAYAYAYAWARTPNVDRLAERGVRFASAYIGTWCMPSRATLLTGLLSHGVQSMKMEGPYPGSTYDPEQCPFWPKVFREHGYFTGQIGKWHTGTDTGFGRDWDFQIVWNRPKFTDNATHYYYDQLITFNGVRQGGSRNTPPITTRAGPKSSFVESIVTRTSPGTCGSATAPLTIPSLRQTGIWRATRTSRFRLRRTFILRAPASRPTCRRSNSGSEVAAVGRF